MTLEQIMLACRHKTRLTTQGPYIGNLQVDSWFMDDNGIIQVRLIGPLGVRHVRPASTLRVWQDRSPYPPTPKEPMNIEDLHRAINLKLPLARKSAPGVKLTAYTYSTVGRVRVMLCDGCGNHSEEWLTALEPYTEPTPKESTMTLTTAQLLEETAEAEKLLREQGAAVCIYLPSQLRQCAPAAVAQVMRDAAEAFIAKHDPVGPIFTIDAYGNEFRVELPREFDQGDRNQAYAYLDGLFLGLGHTVTFELTVNQQAPAMFRMPRDAQALREYLDSKSRQN